MQPQNSNILFLREKYYQIQCFSEPFYFISMQQFMPIGLLTSSELNPNTNKDPDGKIYKSTYAEVPEFLLLNGRSN